MISRSVGLSLLSLVLNVIDPSYDKSASNICESRIWTTIGQTPWAHPYSTWYHRFVDFPFQALRVAARLHQYTLVDRGTWCSIEDDVTKELEVFVSLIEMQMRLQKD
jgi:ABC-type tungstate transport system permease subunit